MTEEPRAYTEKEVCDIFLNHLATLAHYWATVNNTDGSEITTLDRCNGLIHSILSHMAGNGPTLPPIDLVLRPHDDDKDFHLGEGENYFEPHMVIDTSMHHAWHKYERKNV